MSTVKDQPDVQEPKAKSSRQKPTKTLPTERVAFPKQLDILRAYALSSDNGAAVSHHRVAETVDLAATTVSLCNPFFSDTGLLIKADGGYIPTAEVQSFSRTYEWDPEKAPVKLAPILERTWFAATLIPKVKFRPLDDKEAIGFLADASAAGKEYAGQLELLLNYLEASGVVKRENGQIRFGTSGVLDVVATTTAPKTTTVVEVKPTTWGNYDRVIPISLGVGKLAEIRLPEDWNSAKDLSRLLKMLQLSLSEDVQEEEP